MSQPPAAPRASETSSKPARNPVERILVWGLIAAGLVVVALEGRARMAYGQTEDKLIAALEAADDGGVSDFTIEQLDALVVGSPARSESDGDALNNIVHLQWKGLLKSYGLHVTYGRNSRLVTGYTTDNPPPEEPPPAVAGAGADVGDGDAGEGDSAGAEGGGEGGPGGGFGGGPRPDPMASDADGDGKLSREEAPGRMAEFFDNIDTNKDGFLDAAELEARRAARRGGGEGGGGGPRGPGGRPPVDGESSTPQRPESEAPAGDLPPAAEPAPATTESPAPAPEAPAADAPATSEAKPAEKE